MLKGTMRTVGVGSDARVPIDLRRNMANRQVVHALLVSGRVGVDVPL